MYIQCPLNIILEQIKTKIMHKSLKKKDEIKSIQSLELLDLVVAGCLNTNEDKD